MLAGFSVVFWLYVGVSALFAANVGIRLVAWWFTRRDERLQTLKRAALRGIVLNGTCMVTASFAALAYSQWVPPSAALWAVRVGWICIAVICTLITDQWMAELNGHQSGIVALKHWLAAVPKGKLLLFVLLVVSLYLTVSCTPVDDARWNWRDYQPTCVRYIDPCETVHVGVL